MPIIESSEPISDDERRWADHTLAANRQPQRRRSIIHAGRALAVVLVLSPGLVQNSASVWLMLTGLVIGLCVQVLGEAEFFRPPDTDRMGSIHQWLESGRTRRIEVTVLQVRRTPQSAREPERYVLDCGEDSLICSHWWIWNFRDASLQILEDHGREVAEENIPSNFSLRFTPFATIDHVPPDSPVLSLDVDSSVIAIDRKAKTEADTSGVAIVAVAKNE